MQIKWRSAIKNIEIFLQASNKVENIKVDQKYV